MPTLASNNIVRIVWRSLLVAIAIGLGFILAGLNKFGPCVGVIACLFMIPLFLIFPILFFLKTTCDTYGGFSGGVAKMGLLKFVACLTILAAAAGFVGIGLYGSVKDFVV